MFPDTPTSPAAPLSQWQDPPHGGSWRRLEDGSLELLQSTQPATGRAQRDQAPASPEQE